MAGPATGPRKDTRPTDDFAGLTFTDEQKAKIHQIKQDMKSRMDDVAKDEKLTPEQKEAMLEGLQLMESRRLLKLLTPDQQVEVRRRVLARRAAQREEGKKKYQRPPK